LKEKKPYRRGIDFVKRQEQKNDWMNMIPQDTFIWLKDGTNLIKPSHGSVPQKIVKEAKVPHVRIETVVLENRANDEDEGKQ
jgi:hypothetical protein